MKNKWELKCHETEDPYYEITNGQISMIADCGFVGEDDAEEDGIFKNVFNVLNNSGIDFRSNNPLELAQHIEIMELKYEIERLNELLKNQASV